MQLCVSRETRTAVGRRFIHSLITDTNGLHANTTKNITARQKITAYFKTIISNKCTQARVFPICDWFAEVWKKIQVVTEERKMAKIFKNRISLWSIPKGWVRARKTNYERMNSDIRQKLINGYQKHPVELQQYSSLLKERQISVWRTSSLEAKPGKHYWWTGKSHLAWRASSSSLSALWMSSALSCRMFSTCPSSPTFCRISSVRFCSWAGVVGICMSRTSFATSSMLSRSAASSEVPQMQLVYLQPASLKITFNLRSMKINTWNYSQSIQPCLKACQVIRNQLSEIISAFVSLHYTGSYVVVSLMCRKQQTTRRNECVSVVASESVPDT